MLTLITLVFFVTVGGTTVLELCLESGKTHMLTERQKTVLHRICDELAIFNNAFNDFLYFLMSEQFRSTCRRLVKKCIAPCSSDQPNMHVEMGERQREDRDERKESQDLS